MMHDSKEVARSSSAVPDVVAEALSYTKKAETLRDEAIKRLLEQRAEIENHLKALGYVAPVNGNGSNGRHDKPEQSVHASNKRFKDLKLADVGKMLLKEHQRLHGAEIEKLARDGGFRGSENNFQTYLRIAFSREGGFKKVGRNVWALKENH